MTKIGYSDARYGELVADLFSRVPSFQKQGASAYKPGLDRMRQICRIMGDPQNACPCIHVAGTNGKGSTCNMLAAQLSSRGLKVGLYTSPHILDFRERMRVVSSSGVELVSCPQVWDMFQRYDKDFRELELSFFEITTALAFRFFADEKVDVAVIETGLGGRLDATNVITPILSVITNIGLDHTDLLGSTLPLIAREKAGIIKPGVPVVIGECHPETDPVFREVAEALGSPITFADAIHNWISSNESVSASAGALSTPGQMQGEGPSLKDWTRQACLPSDNTEGWEGLSTKCEGPGEADHSEYKEILSRMDLKGSYQEKNLRTVLAAMGVLGLEADFEAIENAARICDFHGRWELVCKDPHTICDIGHNEHGLKYNFAQLDAMLDSGEFSDLVMVYGSVADKDVDAVLGILPQRAHIIFTAADNHRAMPAQTVLEHAEAVFSRLGAKLDAEAVADVPAAVDRAFELCCANMARPLLYIGGSTYVVSEAMESFRKKNITK